MRELGLAGSDVVQNLRKFMPAVVFPGWCNNCQKPTLFVIIGKNLREDVFCAFCRSSNRQRQMRFILDREYGRSRKFPGMKVWNTENTRSLHVRLKKIFGDGYISSEFISPDLQSGTYVNRVRHEDICASSFPSSCFDLVISSDVLEHVPVPIRALKEINRVLRHGGKHVFTVPFIENMRFSDVRAIIDENGNIKCIKKPMYHGDPLRTEGILVYTIFGNDLKEMCLNAGMNLRIEKFSKLSHGIIGQAIVFVAEKISD